MNRRKNIVLRREFILKIWKFHNPPSLFRIPYRTTSLSLTMSPVNCPRDVSDELLNPRITDAFCTRVDKREDSGIVPSLLE